MTWMLFIDFAPAEVSSASVGYLFSVIGRGYTLLLLEDPAEIKGIVIADNRRNFRNIVVGTLQKADSIVDPNGKDVLHGRLGGDFLEFFQEIADAHIPGQRIFLNIDILVVMVLEVPSGNTHFLLKVRADRRLFVHAAALDQNENLFQVHGKKMLIAHTAGLQFQNHFLEQISIGRGVARIENILVLGNVVTLQNTPNLGTGEMHQKYFRLVLSEIFIVHFLLWRKQNHIARSDNHILAIDVEMGLSGSNIQKLPVHSSAAPPGRELIMVAESVITAASDNERT